MKSEVYDFMPEFSVNLSKATEEAFDSFISGYETELSFSDIRNICFTDDTGIDGISAYPDAVKLFLYNRAMEQMPAYSYSFEEITVDGKPGTR